MPGADIGDLSRYFQQTMKVLDYILISLYIFVTTEEAICLNKEKYRYLVKIPKL